MTSPAHRFHQHHLVESATSRRHQEEPCLASGGPQMIPLSQGRSDGSHADSRRWQAGTQDKPISHRGTPTEARSASSYSFQLSFALNVRHYVISSLAARPPIVGGVCCDHLFDRVFQAFMVLVLR